MKTLLHNPFISSIHDSRQYLALRNDVCVKISQREFKVPMCCSVCAYICNSQYPSVDQRKIEASVNFLFSIFLLLHALPLSYQVSHYCDRVSRYVFSNSQMNWYCERFFVQFLHIELSVRWRVTSLPSHDRNRVNRRRLVLNWLRQLPLSFQHNNTTQHEYIDFIFKSCQE